MNGNQMWTMSFEWQDGNAEDTNEAVAQFEDVTDFAAEESAESTTEQTKGQDSAGTTSPAEGEAAQPSPADPDWVKPWDSGAAAMPSTQAEAGSKILQQANAKQNAKAEPMSEEHKTAILGGCLYIQGLCHLLTCSCRMILRVSCACRQLVLVEVALQCLVLPA